ncbi:hypothetical protein BFP70_06710 [Thioclava sp. SK-1]|uniref:DUF6478 family protein n=1 Tax=Thioclava sp. SK-1 TaxID=1889770 RepID=UPI0008244CD5|nr:DUF6478 family protein [Thioclava sp. SK-1]OCX65827.1 hypothetical protein BFP70_06710 [Thioclava sp. SK-1]
MSRLPSGFLDRVAQGRALKRWRHATALVDDLAVTDLQSVSKEARSVKAEIERFLLETDRRLMAPEADDVGIERPLGCDWTWRPQAWTAPLRPRGLAPANTRDKLGSELTIFHDGESAELVLQQQRNAQGAAPFGLQLDVFSFSGSFLSLVVDLPDAALAGLRVNHLVRLGIDLVAERPLDVFCRLNVMHGPNTEQLVRELPMDGSGGFVEFDLAYTRMNEKRLERAWVDIIFEGARMNAINMRDLTFLRHPRAEL